MANPLYERRPEMNQTIIFGEIPKIDLTPIEARNGRLIPGPDFSSREFRLLWKLSVAQDSGETLNLFKLPTQKQLTRIAFNAANGCWDLPVYDDPLPRARYGNLSVKGIPGNLAHKVMYQVFYGVESIPTTDEQPPRPYNVDHLCQRKSCCYPRHLEVVPPAENTRRGFTSRDIGQLGLEFE